MALAPIITSTCAEYFGTHKTVRGKTLLVGNRCDACPLRSPCLAWGAKPSRTLDELHSNGDEFAAAATEILNARRSR